MPLYRYLVGVCLPQTQQSGQKSTAKIRPKEHDTYPQNVSPPHRTNIVKATFKHIASKNADYNAAEAYLLYVHNEFTNKPTRDDQGAAHAPPQRCAAEESIREKKALKFTYSITTGPTPCGRICRYIRHVLLKDPAGKPLELELFPPSSQKRCAVCLIIQNGAQ